MLYQIFFFWEYADNTVVLLWVVPALLLVLVLELAPVNPLNSEDAPFELLWECSLLIEGGNKTGFGLLDNPD